MASKVKGVCKVSSRGLGDREGRKVGGNSNSHGRGGKGGVGTNPTSQPKFCPNFIFPVSFYPKLQSQFHFSLLRFLFVIPSPSDPNPIFPVKKKKKKSCKSQSLFQNFMPLPQPGSRKFIQPHPPPPPPRSRNLLQADVQYFRRKLIIQKITIFIMFLLLKQTKVSSSDQKSFFRGGSNQGDKMV